MYWFLPGQRTWLLLKRHARWLELWSTFQSLHTYTCPFQSGAHTAKDNHACRTRPLLCALICTLSRPASCPAPSLGRPSLQAVMRCEATPILSSISPRKCRMSPCSDERFSINSADGRHRWPPCASARCWCCVQDIDWAAVQVRQRQVFSLFFRFDAAPAQARRRHHPARRWCAPQSA